ncbi:MAG: hypothetical protein MUE78_12650, partial [Ilumatobacteraceae bacterium]|nr:hypothetical protein [Ilumatobacteraceae bacterium]
MLLEHPVEERREAIDRPLGADGCIGLLVMLDEQSARQVREAHAERRRAERRHEEVPGVVPEPDAPRGPAPGRHANLAVLDEATLDERCDAIGHDGPPKAGPALDLLPGDAFVRANEPEDAGKAVALEANSPAGAVAPHSPGRADCLGRALWICLIRHDRDHASLSCG